MSSLNLQMRVDHATAPTGCDSSIAVLASLVAQEQESEKTRNPIDLVVVLDRSGSMQGDKLELCKSTLEFLIQQGLTETDYFALVTFDSNVQIVYSGGKMTKSNKDIVLDKIKKISAGSSTNLSDGLFAGLKLLSAAGTAEVSAVCLLTDGQMNQGISDRNEVAKLTQAMIEAFPSGKAKPSVFTFGYGTDADSETMKLISDKTGGSYYFINNPESVPISFADCLGGLTAVAAQNIELFCEVSGGGAEIKENPLTKFPFERISPYACKIQIKDMYCGEQRDLVMKVHIPKLVTLEATKITIRCTFTDTIHETFLELKEETQVVRYEGNELPKTAPNVEVTRHLLRLEAARAMEEARVAAEGGDIEKGRSAIQGMTAKAVSALAAMGITEDEDMMMAEVVSDLRVATTNMRTAEEFKTVGNSYMMSSAWSHNFQRSNKVDAMMESDEAITRNAYANHSKKQMMKMSKSVLPPKPPQ